MQYIILIVIISTVLVIITFILAAYFNKPEQKEKMVTGPFNKEKKVDASFITPEHIPSGEEVKISEEKIIENKDIAINTEYYKLIQELVVTHKEKLAKYAPESFIIFRPKDVSCGDFYWFADVTFTKGIADEYGEINKEKNTFLLVAAVKCNRPEAKDTFINVVDNLHWNEDIPDPAINSPFDLLNSVYTNFKKVIEQESEALLLRVEMDVSMCAIDFKFMKLNYRGDKNPMYVTRGKHLIEIRRNGQDISTFSNNQILPLTNSTFDLQKGDCIYLFTPGIANQFGGSEGKKFTFKGLKETLLSFQGAAMEEQEVMLHKTFEFWKGALEQDDNVLIIGVMV